jgi:protein arginine kinase
MLLETLLEREPAWLQAAAPESAIAPLCQCSLSRNLADFSFPGQCNEEEKRRIEERVTDVFDNLGLLAHGHYYSLPELTSSEARFLAERRLITFDVMADHGPRGVYVSEDQTLSIMVNGMDHLCIRTILPGNQLQEAWAQLNLMDDTLSGLLDFAFDDRLGYLTAGLAGVGTGLKAGILLHLPGLSLMGALVHQVELAEKQQLRLCGIKAGAGDMARKMAPKPGPSSDALEQALFTDVDGALCGAPGEALGDLFLLVNHSTLGISEEEIVFRARHQASEIATAELSARTGLAKESPSALDDRVFRALGAAGGARLMEFTEGIRLLSSLRLGVERGLIAKHTLQEMNELLLFSQGAHLEISRGQDCDALALSIERAGLFRRIMSGV